MKTREEIVNEVTSGGLEGVPLTKECIALLLEMAYNAGHWDARKEELESKKRIEEFTQQLRGVK